MCWNFITVKDKLKVLYSLPASQRLDKYLVELNIQELYSRSFIERLIKKTDPGKSYSGEKKLPVEGR